MMSVPAPSSIGKAVFTVLKEYNVEKKKGSKTIGEGEYWVAFLRQGGVMGSSPVDDEYMYVYWNRNKHRRRGPKHVVDLVQKGAFLT
jgi:hypothetical protein